MDKESIKYFILKLDNEFLPNYLIGEIRKKVGSEFIGFKLKWRDIVDILIRSEPKQRTHGNRIELYDKYKISNILIYDKYKISKKEQEAEVDEEENIRDEI